MGAVGGVKKDVGSHASRLYIAPERDEHEAALDTTLVYNIHPRHTYIHCSLPPSLPLVQALCQQTLDDWTAKFAPLGIRLAELTSDSSSGAASKGSVSLRDLASADVILTTPEKWDSVTRRWKEHAFLVRKACCCCTASSRTFVCI